jgi:hypothetical protein
MSRARLLPLAASVLAAGMVAGCNLNPAPYLPPARPSIQAGPGYAPYTAYLAAHPQPRRRGMEYGVLVSVVKLGTFCAINGCTWQGTVVIPGGRVEHLSSDGGFNGMATTVAPGDMFWFPAGGPVDAPSDGMGTLPVRIITAGAVRP